MPCTGYYFDAADEDCGHSASIAWHKADMRGKGEVERRLYPAVLVPTTHIFWCQHYDEVCGMGTDYFRCGKGCAHYQPRNGKSGRCKHHGNCRTPDVNHPKVIRIAPQPNE